MSSKSFQRTIFAGAILAGRLLGQEVPETDDIRGPKPLIEIPKPEQADYTLWFVLAGLALLTVLGWFLWRFLRAKQKPPAPSDIALSDLSALGSQGGSMPAAEFAERAALSVRRYISGAFGIAAQNRTTEEFFRELPATSVRDDQGHLHAFLKSCDLAKFAAADLDSDRRAKLIESARNFVITSPQGEGGKQ